MKSIQRTHSILSRAIAHEGGALKLCGKFLTILIKEGSVGISLRIKHLQVLHFQENLPRGTAESTEESISYQTWLDIDKTEMKANFVDLTSRFKHKPLISIVCPIYNPDPDDLSDALNSVLNQSYENWELCLADD